MKRNLLAVITAMAIVFGLHGMAWALNGANGPHADYRTPGYSPNGCSGTNAACHDMAKGSFLPQAFDHLVAPVNQNITNFCLSCHNSSGEAHEKSAGSPSNNAYNNGTGLTLGSKGVSHSWNGKIKNAGTRIPPASSTYFNRTGYMPKGVVACQTCHNAPIKGREVFFATTWANTVDQGDHKNYVLSLGGPTTSPQYLNKYVRVFRSATYLSSPPASRRDWKQYLVSPSEYTYNNTNLTVTFKASQGTSYIYGDLAEPYLRGSNAGNALCTDCHLDRVDSSVSHPSGPGSKNSHPTGIKYGYNFGLHSTLKPAATGNVYLEAISGSDQVLCTSCHDPHNAASDNGQILREADGSALCADCHKTKLGGYSTAGSVNFHSSSRHTTTCLDCHDTHNSKNIMLIKNVINGKAVNFQSFTGVRSFGPDTGYGICEVCHTQTSHHLSSNDPSGQGHNTGLNCTQCHKHEAGFELSGPGTGPCDSCHGFPPSPSNAGPHGYGWADPTGNKHTAHMSYIQKNLSLTGTAACACCHGNRPLSNHPENLDTAYIDPTNSYWQGQWGAATFSNGNTTGKTVTSDDSCTNVGCHFTAGTRYWNDAAAQCDSCHEYPNSANDWDMVAKVNGHTVRASALQNDTTAVTRASLKHLNIAALYNAATDTYDSVTLDTNKCGKCHANVLANHQNGAINVSPNGFAACGGGNFTFNNITTRRVATCSNVECHVDKTTPNWY